jgi:hypothetical protein
LKRRTPRTRRKKIVPQLMRQRKSQKTKVKLSRKMEIRTIQMTKGHQMMMKANRMMTKQCPNLFLTNIRRK